MKEKKKFSLIRELISWIMYLGAGLLIALIIINFVLRLTVVRGESMENTLKDGEILFVDILTTHFSDPERGDIIICTYPNKDSFYVKRVIGLPGETVEIRDGTVYINGAFGLDEWNGEHSLYDMDKTVVPEDCFFVMGDNRSNSMDSREGSVGCIHREMIKGNARFRIYPFEKFGKIEYMY